jgi:hypothetical protein
MKIASAHKSLISRVQTRHFHGSYAGPVLALFLLAFRDHMICYWLHYCGDGNQTLRKLLLAREMVQHIRVLAVLLPSPALRDVVPVFKVQHHLVLMPNRDAGEIAGVQEREGQLLYVPGGWHCAHMRLIVGGAIVQQRNPVTVDAVKRKHLLHARGIERLHHDRVRDGQFEIAFHFLTLLVFTHPITRKTR